MTEAQWVALAGGCGIGLAVAALAWWLVSAVDAVPPEDRSFRDRPPRAFRMVWWPLRWIAHYLGPVLSIDYRQRGLVRLRLAGLDYALSAEQFLAGRLLAAAASAAAAAVTLAGYGLPLAGVALAAAFGYAFPAIWLRDRIQLRRLDTLKTLPFHLDVMTLCVESGLTLHGALAQAVAKGPAGALRDEFGRVLRDMRAGRPRAEALRQLADRMNESAITQLVAALIQAETMGMSLGPILRAQSEQRRAERFARAEKLAMEAPVKLLFPLIAFIFPCTFLVIGFPIVMKFIHMGL